MSEVITQTAPKISMAGLTPIDDSQPASTESGNTDSQQIVSPSKSAEEHSYEQELKALLGQDPELKDKIDLSNMVQAGGATPAPPTQQDPAPTDDDDDVVQVVDEAKPLPKKIHFRPSSHFELEILSLRKQKYDLLTACQMAAKKYPNSPEAKAFLQQQVQPSQPNGEANNTDLSSNEIQSVEELEAQITQLDDLLIDAQMAFDSDRVKELRTQIRQLEKQRKVIEAKEAERESALSAQQEKEFNTTWNASFERAKKLFPSLADTNSALAKKAAELQQAAKENGDEIYFDPSSPMHFATEAALALGIAAGQAPAQQTRVPMPPAKGLISSASTRAQISSPSDNVDPNKWSSEEYEKMMTLIQKGQR